MKKLSFICLLALFALSGCVKSEKNDFEFANPVPLGDPFILLHQETYYAYGTNADDGIQVYTSADLKEWELADGLALQSKDSWGDRWFWAPEVYYIAEKNTFFMYYSADEHICVATSDSPLGPFVQEEKRPMLAGEKAIDNSLFIDEDGTPYLYLDRFNDGLNIWVGKLEDDLITLDTTEWVPSIHVSQEWETVWPRVNEGPYVLKHQDTYYMTYSANSYESPHYGIGFATASSPLGPWTKYEQNPILQMPGDLVGVGHSAMFEDKDGNLKIVFHAHHNKDSIHPRAMHIADVSFSDGNPAVMQIAEEVLTPTLKR